MVTADFPNDKDGRHRDNSRMQQRDNQEEAPQVQKRDWRSSQPRDAARTYRSAKEQLDGPCTLHGFKNERGELRSGHTLRNCRHFTELSKEKSRSTAQPLASVA